MLGGIDGVVGPVINDPRWSMTAVAMAGSDLTTTLINQKMRLGPVIMAYYDTTVQGKHAVVAYGANDKYIAAMNPDGGQFVGKLATYYSQSAEVILGVPTR